MGTLLIIFHEKIAHIMPYLIGGLTIIISLGFIKDAVQMEEVKKSETKRLASGIVMLIVGAIIIIKQENSINFIAIVWGLFGLIRGIDELGEAFYNIHNGKRYIVELIHAIIEISLAILLIYNPFEKISEHIIILGIEYVIISLQLVINPQMVQKKRRSLRRKKANVI
ncbi:MAG: DUF308 domain-containing protein [Oscillospiraceae bacterium]